MPESARVDLSAEPAPVAYDADGALRVRGTRVRLETVVGAFQLGATAEEIAQQYPVVDLPTAYAVIAFYLRRRPEVDAYLAAQTADAAAARAAAEGRFDPAGLRDRLLARRGASRGSA
jgi:uncharacterized protein (DUF433 family)